jgi:hypothetical protein
MPRAASGPQEREDLVHGWESVLLVLGEDELSVADDVELPGPARANRRVEAVCVQLGCETRGPFVVAASDGAVQDLDGHIVSVPPARDGGASGGRPRLAGEMDHPIKLVVTDDLRRSRLTVFFRLLLAIPHFIWIYLWAIAAAVVLLIAWFAALFTKRVPAGLHNFLASYLRYQVHLFGYITLAADPYPAFGGNSDYPIDVVVAPPEEQGRLGVFFRLLLALPALFLSSAMNYLVEILVFFAWFVCLFTGRMPEGMRNLVAFTIRYHAQTQAYYSLLTSRYPSLNVGLE